MKWSIFLHFLAALAAVLGSLALVGAWVAGDTGSVLGFSQAHLFSDASSLLLVSIACGIGTLIHHNLER